MPSFRAETPGVHSHGLGVLRGNLPSRQSRIGSPLAQPRVAQHRGGPRRCASVARFSGAKRDSALRPRACQLNARSSRCRSFRCCCRCSVPNQWWSCRRLSGRVHRTPACSTLAPRQCPSRCHSVDYCPWRTRPRPWPCFPRCSRCWHRSRADRGCMPRERGPKSKRALPPSIESSSYLLPFATRSD